MYTIYMTFDNVYKFLLSGEEIRRHGAEMTKYRIAKNGREVVVVRRLLDRKTWVEGKLEISGFDLLATDWEVVKPSA